MRSDIILVICGLVVVLLSLWLGALGQHLTGGWFVSDFGPPALVTGMIFFCLGVALMVLGIIRISNGGGK